MSLTSSNLELKILTNQELKGVPREEVFTDIVREALGVTPQPSRRSTSGTQPTSMITYEASGKNETVAVKVFLPGLDGQACFSRELAAYQLLAKYGMQGVLNRIPRLYSAGSLINTNHNSSPDCVGQFMITRQVSGKPICEEGWGNTQERAVIARDIGEFLALLHQTNIQNEEIPEEMTWQKLRLALIENRNQLINYRNNQDTPIVARTTVNFGEDNMKAICMLLSSQVTQAVLEGPTKTVALCHGDLHRGHIFVKRSASGILGFNRVIDLADAGFYDPAYEFATVHMDLCNGDTKLFIEILDAYMSTPGAPFLGHDLAQRMQLYSILHVFDLLESHKNSGKRSFLISDFQQLTLDTWDPIRAFIQNRRLS